MTFGNAACPHRGSDGGAADPGAVWSWRTDRELRFVGGGQERPSGALPRMLAGKSLTDIVAGAESRQCLHDLVGDLLSRLPFPEIQCRFVDAAGVERCCRIQGEPIFDESGRFCGYGGTGHVPDAASAPPEAPSAFAILDRTPLGLSAAPAAPAEPSDAGSRQQRLLDLARENARFAAAIEATTSGVAIADPFQPDNPVVFINPAFSLITGYGPDEVLGRNCRFLQGPDTEAAAIDEIRRGIVQRRSVRVELLNYRKEGDPFWNDLTISPIFDIEGDLIGFVSIVNDVTARKAAERAVIVSEERFRDFAEIGADWFWETGLDQRFSYVSNWTLFAGTAIGEAMAGQDAPAAARWADIDAGAAARIAACMAGSESFKGVEFAVPTLSGDEIWVRIAGKPVRDERGAVTGYRGVGTDVTQRRRAEQAMREARDAAQNASRAKSEFLANVSHELRTPLNAIIGFSQVIQDGLFGAIEQPQYRDYVRDIHESGRHLLDVINDILDIAKIEAGKVEIQEEEVDLARLMDAALQVVAKQAEQKSLTLGRSAPDAPVWVHADERRLKQVLLNLLSNAVKFTPEGGSVSLDLSCGRDGVILDIRDTGIGIAEADIATALAAFGQVDSRLGRKYNGTGLGLPLTKALIELHGGRLELLSKVDVGTTARVLLPPERLLG